MTHLAAAARRVDMKVYEPRGDDAILGIQGLQLQRQAPQRGGVGVRQNADDAPAWSDRRRAADQTQYEFDRGSMSLRSWDDGCPATGFSVIKYVTRRRTTQVAESRYGMHDVHLPAADCDASVIQGSRWRLRHGPASSAPATLHLQPAAAPPCWFGMMYQWSRRADCAVVNERP